MTIGSYNLQGDLDGCVSEPEQEKFLAQCKKLSLQRAVSLRTIMLWCYQRARSKDQLDRIHTWIGEYDRSEQGLMALPEYEIEEYITEPLINKNTKVKEQNKASLKETTLQKITSVSGNSVVIAKDDLDTDQIIPARFMKTLDFSGLGEFVFYDLRFDQNRQPKKDFSLNNPCLKKDISILISGNNFGCGSSREHAPQALYYYGFRAIIAQSFAEIFFGNCTTLGIPCLVLGKSSLNELQELVKQNPKESKLEINLLSKKIYFRDLYFSFEIPEDTRVSLIEGKWDPLVELLANKEKVQAKISELDQITKIN